MKRLLALIVAVMIAVSLVACDTSDSAVQKEGSVYWLNFKPEIDGLLQELAARYKEEKGVDVKVYTPDSGKYQSTLLEQLDSLDPPTMFNLGTPNDIKILGSYAADLTDTAIADQVSVTDYNLVDESGKLLALGYCSECFGIVVNPDFLPLVGLTIDDIKDYESLKYAVEIIHNNEFWLGYDAFAPVDFSDESSWKYTAHLANVEYAYEYRASKGWPECPASLTGEYMDNFRNLYDLVVNNCAVSPEKLAKGSYNGLQDFKDGKAAFYLAGSWDYAEIVKEIPNAVMIPYYCGVKGEAKAGLCSSTENRWAVNGKLSEKTQKATRGFMVWLVSDPDASSALSKALGPLPYKKATNDVENGFINDAAKYREDGCYNLPWQFCYQPDSGAYRAGLLNALKAYNSDQSDDTWQNVRKAMIDNWMTCYIAENE